MILLIVLYDSTIFVWTDDLVHSVGDSEMTIRDNIAISYQYCMPGATNYILSGNCTNDNITSTPPSYLSAAAATVAVAYSWVRHKYTVWVPNWVRHDNKQYISLFSFFLCSYIRRLGSYSNALLLPLFTSTCCPCIDCFFQFLSSI